MKQYVSTNGYKCVNLYNSTKQILCLVHILMAKTFLKKTDISQIQVDHENGDKLNNNLSNLRYVSPSENIKNAYKNNKNMQNKKKSVCKLNLDGDVVATYDSIKSASEQNNLVYSSIWNCCNGKKDTSGNFKWIYQKSEETIKLETDEIFKKIDKVDEMYFDSYEISNYGNIRNIKRNKFLSPTNGEYHRFLLSPINGEKKLYSAHRLVAICFLQKNNDPNMVVNHKDKNKKNNFVENLEFCTHSQNTIHSIGKQVCKIDKNTGKILHIYDSISCALKELGKKGNASIVGCCKGRLPNAYGFVWKYLETITSETNN